MPASFYPGLAPKSPLAKNRYAISRHRDMPSNGASLQSNFYCEDYDHDESYNNYNESYNDYYQYRYRNGPFGAFLSTGIYELGH